MNRSSIPMFAEDFRRIPRRLSRSVLRQGKPLQKGTVFRPITENVKARPADGLRRLVPEHGRTGLDRRRAPQKIEERSGKRNGLSPGQRVDAVDFRADFAEPLGSPHQIVCFLPATGIIRDQPAQRRVQRIVQVQEVSVRKEDIGDRDGGFTRALIVLSEARQPERMEQTAALFGV